MSVTSSSEQSEIENDDSSIDYIGTHEVLECQEGELEAGLDVHTKKCNKPHDGFIPIQDLSTQHFPPGYHDDDLLEFTKTLAELTVKIDVKFISNDRPKLTPITREPYPFYHARGKRIMTVGTGRVYEMTRYTEDMDESFREYRTCPCPICVTSNTPKDDWWEAVVLTSRHVVFDDIEAKRSSCRLWYDSKQSPLIKLYGWEMAGSNTERDMAMFYCATHDLEVGDQLEKTVRKFDNLQFEMWEKYKDRAEEKVMIIVSHPHGCVKHVSVGRWVEKEQKTDRLTSYTYTNCTCRGSSGAQIYRVGCKLSDHPHRGFKLSGLNQSGCEVD